jgi:hypothetical protein
MITEMEIKGFKPTTGAISKIARRTSVSGLKDKETESN